MVIIKLHGVLCGNNVSYKADTIVFAIGNNPDYKVIDGIEITNKGLIKVNEFGETSKENVFAGGDLVNELKNVSKAIKSTLIAVDGIDNKMKKIKH